MGEARTLWVPLSMARIVDSDAIRAHDHCQPRAFRGRGSTARVRGVGFQPRRGAPLSAGAVVACKVKVAVRFVLPPVFVPAQLFGANGAHGLRWSSPPSGREDPRGRAATGVLRWTTPSARAAQRNSAQSVGCRDGIHLAGAGGLHEGGAELHNGP